MAETISSAPTGKVTSIDPVRYASIHSIKALTEIVGFSGIGVISSPGLSLTNRLGFVTRALCRKYKGKSINKGDVIMNDSFKINGCHNCPPHPPHPPCPSHCPCMEQEYVLSEGHKVNIEKGKEVKHDFVLDPNPFKDCGTLSGRVKDKHGHPIANALVNRP